jgi:pyruvate/2-oxoglutarate dehydrogenase complex dihydrolipoamide dehydrogenase (E3) component
MTEAQAREQGFEVATGRFDYADLTRPIITGDTGGFIKIVAEASSGRILGGHIIGADASVLIHEIAAAMKANLTAADIGDVLHAYRRFQKECGTPARR